MEEQYIYRREVNPESDDSLGIIVRQIPKASNVLELGVATGYVGQFLKDKWECTVDGVERHEGMAREAMPAYRKLLVEDLEKARLADHFQAGAYNVIICADILEHVYDPGAVLGQLPVLLAPGGKVIISIPNTAYAGLILDLIDGNFKYRALGLQDRTHIRFFTRETILALLDSRGFEISRVEQVHMPFEGSEFFERLNAKPVPLKNYLFSFPDGDTYQFVITAHPKPLEG